MKHFPIQHQGIFLGVALVFKDHSTWKLTYLRDDRLGPTFSMAEIAIMITTGCHTTDRMMIAKLGFVIHEIENYTELPLTSLPRQKRNNGMIIKDERILNPFLRMVRHEIGGEVSPWMADFMLPMYKSGRVVFEDVPSNNTMLFEIEHDSEGKIIISGDSNINYCRFSGDMNQLHNIHATFCQFNNATVKNQGIHNGYVFGRGEDLRVCL